jgi:hypothetical protein
MPVSNDRGSGQLHREWAWEDDNGSRRRRSRSMMVNLYYLVLEVGVKAN